jgi:hypothetical protein
MLRATGVLAVLLLAGGCTFGLKPCPCGPEAECFEGICVLKEFSDGGTGKGGAEGGGGGSTLTGGGSGGGSTVTGGGSTETGGGGGAVDLCPALPTCDAGYACEPATGQCALHLTGLALVPADGALTNNTSVNVTATLMADAPVAYPPTIDLVVNGTTTFAVPGNGSYSKMLTLSEGVHS